VFIWFDKGIFEHFALLDLGFWDPLLNSGLYPAGEGFPVFFFLCGHDFFGKFIQLFKSLVFFAAFSALVQVSLDFALESGIQLTIKVCTQEILYLFVSHLLPP
jgi:hypothetical protein